MHPLFPFVPLRSVKADGRVHFCDRIQNEHQHNTMRPYTILLLLLIIILGISCRTPEIPLPEPVEPIHADVVERGEYMVEIMGCHDCHSPKIMTEFGPVPDPDRLLSGHPANEKLPPVNAKTTQGWLLFNMGGTAAVGPWGTSFSGNLTSDDSGIGNWTEEQFKRAITKGLYKGLEGSRPLLPPMPWQNFKNISDADVHAIYTYLQSTKAVENVVPAPQLPGQP
jgi:mono/diheme cytochrome c family protein